MSSIGQQRTSAAQTGMAAFLPDQSNKITRMYDLTKIAGAIATVAGLDLIKELYKDLAQPGVKQVGKAIENILKVPNLALAVVTKWEGRQNIALEANLEAYRIAMAKVPVEKVVAVPPEVGVPLVEKLTYVKDKDLSQLYVELLASASNIESAGSAHPAFAHLIDSLSPDEARLLKQFSRRRYLPFVEVRIVNDDRGHIIHQRYVVTPDVLAGICATENFDAYINNLERLGIITTSNEQWLTEPGHYEVLENSVKGTDIAVRPDQRVEPQKGVIEVTPYGRLFMQACKV